MLLIGSLLVGAGALAVGLLALLFRHPRAPRWIEPELVAMLATIPVTAMLGLGLGYLLSGGYQLLHGKDDLYALGAPLLAAVVIAAAYQLSRIRGRLAAYDAARAGPNATAMPPPIPEGASSAPSPAGLSHGPAREAA
jgi:heme A synthase